MFCNKCGQQLADNAAFCNACGSPVQAPQPEAAAQVNENPQQAQAPQPEPQQYAADNQQATADNATSQNNNFVNQVLDTKDHTSEYAEADIKNGKVMAILSYLGIFVLIPLFAERNNQYVRFHVNQGFTLFLINIAISILTIATYFMPIVGVIIRIILSLAVAVMAILGLINAFTDKAKELPFIGSVKLVN